MLRRTLLPAWAVLIMAAALLGNAGHVQAQNNTCCTFYIAASNLIPPGCFPITVTTNWGAGAGTTQNDIKATPGSITPYTVPGCPPFQNFNWVSLDGGTTRVTLGGGAFMTLPCGTVVCLHASVNPETGCVEIRISVSPTCPP